MLLLLLVQHCDYVSTCKIPCKFLLTPHHDHCLYSAIVLHDVHKWFEGLLLVQYDDQWKRRDVLGVHPQRQEGLFWVGACVPVGRLQSDDMDDMAHIAET